MTDKNKKIKADKDYDVIIGLHGEDWDYEFSFPSTESIDLDDIAKCTIALDEYHKFIKKVKREAEKCNRDYVKTIKRLLADAPDDMFFKILLLENWDEFYPLIMQDLCKNDMRLGFSLLKSKVSTNSERKKGLEILRGENLGLSLSKIAKLSKISEEELKKLIQEC